MSNNNPEQKGKDEKIVQMTSCIQNTNEKEDKSQSKPNEFLLPLATK